MLPDLVGRAEEINGQSPIACQRPDEANGGGASLKRIRRADAAPRADGAKYIGRHGALVLGRRGPAIARCPAPREPGLPTDPGFIPPPDSHVGVDRKAGAGLLQFGGEVFSKSSTANSLCPWRRGRAEILANPSARSSRRTVGSSTKSHRFCSTEYRAPALVGVPGRRFCCH